IIMAKATLKCYPVGNHRKIAIIENARYVFLEALAHTPQKPSSAPNPPSPSPSAMDVKHSDHLFLQRTQLLAVMMNSFIQGKSQGRFRRKAIDKNIDQISEYLSNHFQLGNIQFLKVA
ncbi:MAG: hypothetical protein PVI60_02660, partial [Desulfobacteraceae bacterium]